MIGCLTETTTCVEAKPLVSNQSVVQAEIFIFLLEINFWSNFLLRFGLHFCFFNSLYMINVFSSNLPIMLGLSYPY